MNSLTQVGGRSTLRQQGPKTHDAQRALDEASATRVEAEAKANDAAERAGQPRPFGKEQPRANEKSRSTFEDGQGRMDLEKMMGRAQSANGMPSEYSSDVPMMKPSEMMQSVSV